MSTDKKFLCYIPITRVGPWSTFLRCVRGVLWGSGMVLQIFVSWARVVHASSRILKFESPKMAGNASEILQISFFMWAFRLLAWVRLWRKSKVLCEKHRMGELPESAKALLPSSQPLPLPHPYSFWRSKCELYGIFNFSRAVWLSSLTLRFHHARRSPPSSFS